MQRRFNMVFLIMALGAIVFMVAARSFLSVVISLSIFGAYILLLLLQSALPDKVVAVGDYKVKYYSAYETVCGMLYDVRVYYNGRPVYKMMTDITEAEMLTCNVKEHAEKMVENAIKYGEKNNFWS